LPFKCNLQRYSVVLHPTFACTFDELKGKVGGKGVNVGL
jgi:hypothetical protein